MASLVTKNKRGRDYLYWVRSARVNGKPRIVEQVYLGPKDRVLDDIKQRYTKHEASTRARLKEVQSREFGASAVLLDLAQRLGLAEIVDRHVPPPLPRRRTHLSVGQYLVIAAINRAIDARSKRALYEDWYQYSVIERLVPAADEDLTSQRFWDHMDQVETEHIEAIQRDLLERLAELYPLGEQTVLYDSTNFFTFIDTFNDRPELPQRGANKQKRADLRQVSLSLFEDEDTGLPLYHQCYPGNRNDVSQFGEAWEGMLEQWLAALRRRPEQLTLVFDGGNTSKRNLRQLEDQTVHYVAALSPGWLPDLLDLSLRRYRRLELPGTKHLKVYRTRRILWGRERSLVMTFSPTLYTKQRRTMNLQQAKVEDHFRELTAAIESWRQSGRGRGHLVESVKKKIERWTAREHLRDYLDVEMETEGELVVALRWRWDRSRKREVQRRWLGKRILVTDQHEWSDAEVILAYRKLHRTENLFRISKSRRGPWWPMFHWTDSKIRVHALYCHFALLMLAIIQRQLEESGVVIAVDRAIEQLGHIQESLVIYSDGSADRVLSAMSTSQQQIAVALELQVLAKRVGTTVLSTA
jgi:transposase